MKRHNILFIDDDKEVLKSYNHIFQDVEKSKTVDLVNELFDSKESTETPNPLKSNYRIYQANQGEEGVSIIEKMKEKNDPIKVAFVDMRMPPGIDGRETCKRIRAIDPDIELVIVTAYSDHKLEDVVNDVGSPSKLLYLKKPFDPVEIKQIAQNLTSKWDSLKIKDEFLANISHELKTPLASIIGFSDLLSEEECLNEESQEYVGIIKQNGTLMKNLIEDLFILIKLGRQNMHLQKDEFNISDLCKKILRGYEPLVDKSKMKLDFKCEDEININADRNKITQCIVNLLSNAIKFTESGEVLLSLTSEKEHVRISVQDSGVGISEENLKSIFNKFERVEKDHHEIPGLGLGLSICKTIMSLHGGDIEVESTLGKGSIFTLIIPIS